MAFGCPSRPYYLDGYLTSYTAVLNSKVDGDRQQPFTAIEPESNEVRDPIRAAPLTRRHERLPSRNPVQSDGP